VTSAFLILLHGRGAWLLGHPHRRLSIFRLTFLSPRS